MLQSWGKLLFMHWPIEADLLRPLLPVGLELDTHEGRPYIGVIPFTMWGIRATFLPPIPGLSAMHELNVRTYVKYRGVPGVYFFSLDAARMIAVRGARRFWKLPYFHARMSLEQNRAGKIKYTSQRIHEGATPATFFAIWDPGDALPPSAPNSLAHFLTERYRLFTEHAGQICECRIQHEKWPLREAVLEDCRSTMLEALGLPEPAGAPVLHYAEELTVNVGPLRKFQ